MTKEMDKTPGVGLADAQRTAREFLESTLPEVRRVDFTKMKDPIIGFVFDVKGFMADISLKGAKFTKINPK